MECPRNNKHLQRCIIVVSVGQRFGLDLYINETSQGSHINVAPQKRRKVREDVAVAYHALPCSKLRAARVNATQKWWECVW